MYLVGHKSKVSVLRTYHYKARRRVYAWQSLGKVAVIGLFARPESSALACRRIVAVDIVLVYNP